MTRSAGFIVPASLFILLALFVLALGLLFLTRVNLGVLESEQAHAIAKFNGEGGIEAAILVLNQAYDANGEFPATFTGPPTSPSGGLSYQLAANGYTTYVDASGTRTQAMVVMEGLGPRNASYRTEVLIGVVPGAPGGGGGFNAGLISESIVTVNGNIGGGGSYSFTNAQVHGNAGLYTRRQRRVRIVRHQQLHPPHRGRPARQRRQRHLHRLPHQQLR